MEVKKQKYLSHLAYESFNIKILKYHFNTFYLIKGFFIAFCLSFFIYAEYFEATFLGLNTLFAFFGFLGLLTCNKKELFFTGFFIGLFWFYWISFSFRYYNLSYLIPFIIIAVGFIYGLIFYFIGFFKYLEFRMILFLFLGFLHPFGFNWFKPELILINTYAPSTFYGLGFLLLSLVFLLRFKGYLKLFFILPLTLSFTLKEPQKKEELSLHVSLSSLHVDQEKKWSRKYQKSIIENNIAVIKKAIKQQKDIVILPESAFPVYLNKHIILQNRLKNLSHKITIITGALSLNKGQIQNSTYLFDKGTVQLAHKVVLVPFGEQIPLPKFARDIINTLFFNGAKDYKSAKEPFDFTVHGIRLRNAICFEATTDKLFKNNPKYMVAISNNAWFTPSIEPTLQKLLLKYYARKYGTTIFHSANAGISEIIR